MKTINAKILIRSDTTSNWASANPILAKGQIGFDNTVGKHKIGNGIDHWNDLEYFALMSDIASNSIFISATEPQTATIGDAWFVIEDNQS